MDRCVRFPPMRFHPSNRTLYQVWLMQPAPQLTPAVRPTPQLVLTRELLTLAADDLAARIEAEMADNPALDWVEDPARERRSATASASRASHADTIDYDFRAPRSLADYLTEQVRVHPSLRHVSVAVEIIGSLDHRGWLAESIAALAERLGVAEEIVSDTLAVVQSLDPPGTGARDAREALLIQLDQLDGVQHARRTLARRLVADHWTDFSHQAWSRLARALKTPESDIRDAAAFIRDNLAPYPAHTFWGEDNADPVLTPDVILHLDPRDPEGPFKVTVVEATRYRLHVPRPIASAATHAPQVDEYVTRARLFIASLHQRWRTIAHIALAVAEAQRGFVLGGSRDLKPLTQVQLAAELDIHESTISRTIRGKFAQLPDGRIVPLSAFFAADGSAKDALRSLVAGEQTPLTDQELCEALSRQGHHLSRRTIAKYRDELGIPAAHRRARTARSC